MFCRSRELQNHEATAWCDYRCWQRLAGARQFVIAWLLSIAVMATVACNRPQAGTEISASEAATSTSAEPMPRPSTYTLSTTEAPDLDAVQEDAPAPKPENVPTSRASTTTELAERVVLHGGYSIRPPGQHTALPPTKLGTPHRWQVQQRWKAPGETEAVFQVTIERDPEYSQAQWPRVSSRVLPSGDRPPVVVEDETLIVPGAEIHRTEIDGLPAIEATSRADQPPSTANAVVYAAYDRDRLIHIVGWYSGPHKPEQHAVLRAAAASLARDHAAETVAAPDDLVVDEQAFPARLEVTKLDEVVAVENIARAKPEFSAVAISDGGRFVACGTTDGFLRAYDVGGQVEIASYQLKGGLIDQVIFYGQHLAVGTSHFLEKSAEIDLLRRRSRETYYSTLKAVSADGSRVAGSRKFAIVVSDPFGQDQQILGGERPDVSALMLSDDGNHVAFGSVAGDVLVWRGGAEKVDFFAKGVHAGRVAHVALSPDEKHLISAGDDKKLLVFDLENKKELHKLADFGKVTGMVAAADNRHIVLLRDGALERWSLASAERVKRYELPFAASVAGFSRDRKYAVAAKAGGSGFDDLHFIALED